MVYAAVAFLPVLLFLAALVFMDSFKLVPGRAVFAAVFAGGLSALAASALNPVLADALGLGTPAFARTVAPLAEEVLKALFVVFLIRRGRVGFLVDAAILGFAVGTGFALVENLEYLRALPERGLLLWLVRGFGTALLHGGTTAIFAIVTTFTTGGQVLNRRISASCPAWPWPAASISSSTAPCCLRSPPPSCSWPACPS